MAEAYQIVLRVENGQYVGRGLELPDAMGRGATARACVRVTRAALVSAVEGLLEAGRTPPVPEFPASPQAMGRGRAWAVPWARSIAFLTTGICVLAIIGVATLGAETVVFSGPAIACLSLVVIVFGVLGQYWWMVGLGVAHLLICVVFVATVIFLRLTPDTAYAPFLCVGVPCVIGLIRATAMAARRAPRAERPWQCDGCGYLLVGLSEPRCPECGRGFDPRRWAGMAMPAAAAAGAR